VYSKILLLSYVYVFCYSKFIQDKYNLPETTSGYIAGSVYYLSMVLSPFLGFVIVSLVLLLPYY